MVRLLRLKSGWLRAYAPPLVIVVFFLAFFSPVVFSHKFLVTSDAFNYLYPLRTVAWNEVRHGRLPLWTSQIMSGYPLLSMAQVAIGYPLTWTYLLLPGYWAEQLYFLAPYLLTPAFMYAYLRRIQRSKSGALLGALAFTYGGFMISPLASYSGLAANAMMWLPLMLFAIEGTRIRRFLSTLLLAILAYSMCVLSGWGQGFVYVGVIALVYSVFISWLNPGSPAAKLWSWKRWAPLGATLLSIGVGAGIDAFQILETLQVQRLSIRKELTFELFAMGSYSLVAAIRSFFVPLHTVFEASAYVAPLVFVLAVIGIVAGLRGHRDWKVFFWMGVAAVGFLLMLGQNAPVAALLFRVPPFNLFRGAARHAFEVTFGLSILSVFGWDAARDWSSKRLANRIASKRTILIGASLLIVSLSIGLLWIRDISQYPVAYMEMFYYPPKYSESRYLFWKLSFFILCVAGTWFLLQVRASWKSTSLLTVMIALACFVEPAIMVSRWWWPTLKPAGRFTATSPATSHLQSFPATENRIYTHVYPMVEEYADPPRLEPANLTMLYGLDNVAGNEPLIIDRYSRALGDVYIDAVKTRPGYPSDFTLFESQSHVLDLLNTSFVVSYPFLATEPIDRPMRGDVMFNPRDLSLTVEPGKNVTLKGAAAEADTLFLVTSTAFSAEAVDGTEVARVRLISSQGKVIERPLRLGIDTAEWAYDRPNVRPIVRHSLPKTFSSAAADQSDPLPAYRFMVQIPLGERMVIDRIEINNPHSKIVLVMSHATLYDSAARFSMPLPHYDLKKWQAVYSDEGSLVLRNKNVLPRAWLVAEAEAVNSEDALMRIRGQGLDFDPRRTALLEVAGGNLPQLPGGTVSSSATARVTDHSDNKIHIETNADSKTMLIVSEVHYPGWVATVDGNPTTIYQADYVLRGVELPPGPHQVVMRYTAPAARRGAIISIATLLLVIGMTVYARLTAKSYRERSNS